MKINFKIVIYAACALALHVHHRQTPFGLGLLDTTLTAESALPITNNADGVEPLPQEQLNYLKRRVTFARATYCIDGLKDWSCVTCDKRYKVSNISFAGEFESTVFGYVGYAKSIKTVIVAFRGTRTFDGWIRDLRFMKPDSPFPNSPHGAKVHLGFLEAWMFLKPQIVEALLNLVRMYPSSDFLISGHSLGIAFLICKRS
jgi:hypothetical protein